MPIQEDECRLVIQLFERNVPEVADGTVRIEACAREAGVRTKIAVSSRDPKVDPVVACVGEEQAYVRRVVEELRGEPIDIVPYSDDIGRFAANAVAPARVVRVYIDDARKRLELVVEDESVDLAIGDSGRNARLAADLTGWTLDIYAKSKMDAFEARSLERMAALEGVGPELARRLFELGWHTTADLAAATPAELAEVQGIDTVERAAELIDHASRDAE